jgi:hypothetical protein
LLATKSSVFHRSTTGRDGAASLPIANMLL